MSIHVSLHIREVNIIRNALRQYIASEIADMADVPDGRSVGESMEIIRHLVNHLHAAHQLLVELEEKALAATVPGELVGENQ